MAQYKLATIKTETGSRAAAIIGDRVFEIPRLTGQTLYVTVQDVLDDWPIAHPLITEASSGTHVGGMPLSQAKLLSPLPRPRMVYGAGANYRDHAEEMAAATKTPLTDPKANGGHPWFFLKAPHTVVGPEDPLKVTAYGKCIDWEAELAVVIGVSVRDVSVGEALNCVAGYMCANDISARDQFFRRGFPENSPFHADWTRHKNFDDSCPLGPWIIPAQHISDVQNLPVRLLVNGEIKQDSTTANMIFSVAEQIASLSRGNTLHPGDVVLTGTPAGVGAMSGQFLAAGDKVAVEIGEIGTLENIVA